MRLVPRFYLELFSLDSAEGVKDQLDDAVVFEWRQGDQLRCCSHDNPERWMLNEVHGSEGWRTYFQLRDPLLNGIKAREKLLPIFLNICMQYV